MHKILWEALIAGLYPTLVAGLIWYTHFKLIIEKQFWSFIACPFSCSLEYCTHSVKLTLIKANY